MTRKVTGGRQQSTSALNPHRLSQGAVRVSWDEVGRSSADLVQALTTNPLHIHDS